MNVQITKSVSAQIGSPNGRYLNVRANVPFNPSSTVVIHHGYGGSIDSPVIKRLSQVFLENNYAVVLPNTQNSLNDSGGDIASFTFSGHASDLLNVCHWAREQRWFTPSSFDLVGYSLGGFSVINVSAEIPDVRSLFLVAPILSGQFFQEGIEAANTGIMKIWKQKGALSFTNDQGKSFNAPYSCWNEWLDATAQDDAEKFRGQVHVITAGQDKLIKPKHVRVLERSFSNATVDLASIENEDHFFSRQPKGLEDWAKAVIKRTL